MIGYQISCHYNPNPSDLPAFYQPGFFFNQLEHLQQQTTEQFYVLTAVNQRTGKAEARCAFFVQADQAVSPRAAPFGSIEFANTLPESILDAFLTALTEATQATGLLTTLRLINYPHCYAPKQTARLKVSLAEHGFQLTETYQTYYLPVTSEPFADNLVPAERRRLRKCREAGFLFTQWTSPNVTDVVNFLRDTRHQQGYRLTICPTQLIDLLRKFPERFSVFRVDDGRKLAALAVTVRVREDILYVFMPASHPDYRTSSPMVFLTAGLYAYCQKEGICLLDLGTSVDENHRPKPSLIRFKQNLGAQESPKYIFKKRFRM